jgi:hypothetical protein
MISYSFFRFFPHNLLIIEDWKITDVIFVMHSFGHGYAI